MVLQRTATTTRALLGRGAALFAAAAVLATGASPAESSAPLSGDAVARNAECAGCHAGIAAEWRRSLHRAAHDDPSFRASFAREPRAFCGDCHAPEGAAPTTAALGVACTTCHRGDHGAASHRASDSCGFCHEFSFPDRADSTRPADRMQLTVTEHRMSAHAEESCASCHMPRVDGPGGAHRSHAFAASRDVGALAQALVARARTPAPDVVEVVLRPGRVGHAFPTGDLFRRLEVGVERFDEHGERVGFAVQSVGRTFASRRGRQEEVADTRPGAPGQADARLRFVLPAVPRGRSKYWVDYERIAAASGDVVEVEARTRIVERWVEDTEP
jgi:Cytochrome c7 and related cytochrome c